MVSIELLRQLGTIGLYATFLPFLAFVIIYAVRSPWRRSEYGLHLMSFMGSFTLVLGMIVLRQIFFPDGAPLWFEVIRTLTFVILIPPVAYWRLWLLIREQNQVKEEKRENESRKIRK